MTNDVRFDSAAFEVCKAELDKVRLAMSHRPIAISHGSIAISHGSLAVSHGSILEYGVFLIEFYKIKCKKNFKQRSMNHTQYTKK